MRHVKSVINFFLFFFIVLFLINCEDRKSSAGLAQPNKTYEQNKIPVLTDFSDSLSVDSISEFALCYLVVADTGNNYLSLREKMREIASKTNLTIDTLGREFSVKSNKIALPENDEDEMYAGEYYPRRYPTNNLSIENLSFYYNKSSNNKMALVISITETSDSALFYAKKIQAISSEVFILRTHIYMGCMH